MQLLPDAKLQEKFNRWSYYLVIITIAVPILTLFAWQFDWEKVKSPLPRVNAMNPVTATLFILSAIAFLLVADKRKKAGWRNAGYVLAAVVFVAAGFKLISQFAGHDGMVDHLLFARKFQPDARGRIIGNIARYSAVCFVLASISVTLLGAGARRSVVAAQIIALIMALFSWLSVLGYIYDVEIFHGPLHYLPMALHSAVCFLCLSGAILFASSHEGIMQQFTSRLNGSLTARLLIPVAVLIPTLLGLLRLSAYRSGVLDNEYGLAIYTLIFISIFLFITWYIAFILNKRHQQEIVADDMLRKSEQEISAIFNAAPDAVIVIDRSGRVVRWNPESENLFGWKMAEVKGKQLKDIVIPERLRDAHTRGMERYLETGTSHILGRTIEIMAQKKDGSEFDIALRIAPVSLQDDLLFVGFIRDITEKKKTDEKLKNFNEELLRQVDEKTRELTQIFERLTDGFISLDSEFRYTYANKRIGEFTQMDPATLIGRNVWEVFPDAVGSATYLAFHKALREQRYVVNTDHYAPLDLWQENHIYPSPGGLSVFIRDITERKRAERRVEEARQLADKLIDALPGVFYFYDADGKFIRWNKQFESVTGYSGEEIAGMHPRDFFADDQKEYITGRIRDVFANGINDAEADFLTKTGERIPYYFKAVRMEYRGQPCLLGYGNDMSERRKFELELVASEQKYKLLFDNNPLPMWMLSLPEYRVLNVNVAALKQYGYDRDEFLALDIHTIRPPEDRDPFRKAIDTEFRGVHYSGVWRHQKKSGEIIYVDIITHDLYYEGQPARLILANDVTNKYIAEEKLKQSFDSIRELTEHLQRVREEERTHIAREIHDELGQQLTVLKMDLAWLQKKITGADGPLQEKMKELLSMVDKTVKTVRRIASDLRPSLLDDLGLVAAMEWHLEEFERRSGIQKQFQGPESDGGLSNEVKIGLFRIFQESLTNVARHSQAKKVRVDLARNNNKVILTITDDGIGFAKASEGKKTLGILGMKERTGMLGGEYSIEGKSGEGTTVSVIIPLNNSENQK